MTCTTADRQHLLRRLLPGLPRRGWVERDVEDLGEVAASCDLCGTDIRFVHEVTHPFGHRLAVGCVCAGHLTQDYASAEARERAARRVSTRRETWVASPSWRRTAAGTSLHRKCGRYRVVVGASFAALYDGGQRVSYRASDVAHAKARAFDELRRLGALE
jgi:hypothetical protein